MYIPKFYRLGDDEAVEIMKSYPFATMVTVDNYRPIATHIPVEIREENGKVFAAGHIAYGNMQKNHLDDGDALLIFQGPHSYVSSSWYGAENVPTWDYLAVHAYGKARIISGGELESHLASLLQHYESGRENGRVWDTFTPGYIQNQIRGIIGFEIEITSIEAAGKMSQNRNDADYKAIVAELEKLSEKDANKVAQWMRNRRPHLF